MSAEATTREQDWRADVPVDVSILPTAAATEVQQSDQASFEGVVHMFIWHEERYDRELSKIATRKVASANLFENSLSPVLNFDPRTGQTFTTRIPEEHVELLTDGRREKRLEAYEDTRRAVAKRILSVFKKDV